MDEWDGRAAGADSFNWTRYRLGGNGSCKWAWWVYCCVGMGERKKTSVYG